MIPLTSQQKTFASENIHLAQSFTKQLINRVPNLRHHQEDLQQAAYMGLIQAAQRFDSTKASFGTYAYWWMRAETGRYTQALASPVRLPQNGRAFGEQFPEEDWSAVGSAPQAPRHEQDTTTALKAFKKYVLKKPLPTAMEQRLRDLLIFERVHFNNEVCRVIGLDYGLSKQRVHQIFLTHLGMFERFSANVQRKGDL